MKLKLNYWVWGLFLIFLQACTQQVPKEKAYPRVYFPKKSYKKFKSECNYSFEIPTYCQVENKEFFRNERLKSDSCWVNIVFGSFNGKLHVSYKHFENQDSLTQLMEQHYKLTSKHIVKSSIKIASCALLDYATMKPCLGATWFRQGLQSSAGHTEGWSPRKTNRKLVNAKTPANDSVYGPVALAA
jgi:hypothetical protein